MFKNICRYEQIGHRFTITTNYSSRLGCSDYRLLMRKQTR